MHTTKTIRRKVLAAMLGAGVLGSALLGAVPAPAHAANEGAQFAARRANNDALAAAKRDFAQFVETQLRRPGGLPAGFPLEVTNVDDLKQAQVSYGFPVFTIDPPDMLAGRGTMQSMTKHTNSWRFVITLADRPIGMATVERNQGKFETVAYGGAVLSKDLDALARHHGNADKSNLRFVRIYQARADLLEVMGADNRARFAPMHSARQSLALKAAPDRADLLEEQDLQQPLRTAIKQNLDAMR